MRSRVPFLLPAALMIGLTGCTRDGAATLRVGLNSPDIPYDPGYRVYSDWDADGIPNRYDNRVRQPRH